MGQIKCDKCNVNIDKKDLFKKQNGPHSHVRMAGFGSTYCSSKCCGHSSCINPPKPQVKGHQDCFKCGHRHHWDISKGIDSWGHCRVCKGGANNDL